MEYKNFDDLVNKAKAARQKKPVAIIGADDPHTMEASVMAAKEDIVDLYLIGNSTKIKKLLVEYDYETSDDHIIHCERPEEMAFEGVRLVREGKVAFLMKGLIETSTLMKAILNKETGIRTNRAISHVNFTSVRNYGKIFCVTDSAIVSNTDLDHKKDILQNAVDAMRALGYEQPKVACLCAIEKVNPAMQETVDAAELKAMSLNGRITGCVVDGPVSIDIAFDSEGAASIKGYTSEVVGQPDILVMPTLAAGNILAKALRIFADSISVGVVMGAKVPFVLLSRSTPVRSKYYSLVIASAMV